MKEQSKHEEPLGKDTIESEEAAKNKRKNYNLLIIILILLLVFLVPMLATYFVFKCDAFAFWVEESSAGDFLGYFASFFALAATIVIAVKQTEISEEMYKIEEDMLRIEQDRARIEAIGRKVNFEFKGFRSKNDGILAFNNFRMVLQRLDSSEIKEFKVIKIECTPYINGKEQKTVDSNKLTNNEKKPVYEISASYEIINDINLHTYMISASFNKGCGYNKRVEQTVNKMIVYCIYSYTTIFDEKYEGFFNTELQWRDKNESLKLDGFTIVENNDVSAGSDCNEIENRNVFYKVNFEGQVYKGKTRGRE